MLYGEFIWVSLMTNEIHNAESRQLLGQTTKQPLSKIERWKPQKYK